MKKQVFLAILISLGTWVSTSTGYGQEKPDAIASGAPKTAQEEILRPFKIPESIGGSGHRIIVREQDAQFPLAVVRGTPYEMGHHLGRLFAKEIQTFVPAALEGISQELKLPPGTLNEVWSRTSSYGDDRLEQELAGLADGSGCPLSTLQALHAVPLLMP
ncbi:MAG: hypothetical protein ACK5GJ_12180 [Planctomycetota bacterium]